MERAPHPHLGPRPWGRWPRQAAGELRTSDAWGRHEGGPQCL